VNRVLSKTVADRLVAGRMDRLRQRIRTRYPILKDGTVGTFSPAHGITRSMSDLAIACLRSNASVPMAAYAPVSQERLRDLIDNLGGVDIRPIRDHAYICVMASAPKKVHVYWSLPQSTRSIVARDLADTGESMALRFYDVTDIPEGESRWHHSFDVDVALDEHARYAELWAANRDYRVEFGLRRRDGVFLPLAASRPVHVPSDYAGVENFYTMHAQTDLLRNNLYTPVERKVSQATILTPDSPDWPLRDIEAERTVRTLYRRFRTEGPRALRNVPVIARRDNTLLEAEYASRQARMKKQESSRIAAEVAKGQLPEIFAVRLDKPKGNGKTNVANVAAAPVEKREALQNPPMVFVADTNDDVTRLTKAIIENYAARKAAESAAKVRAAELKAEAQELSIAREEKKRIVLSGKKTRNLLSSLEEAGVELEAELILRGRVKAGKRVRIGGQIINPNPDGTFCVSCVIRDGKLHVPVEAVEAETVVARQDITVSMDVAVHA